MFGPGVASACHEGHPGHAGRPSVKHRSWAVGSWPWEAGLLNLKTLVNANRSFFLPPLRVPLDTREFGSRGKLKRGRDLRGLLGDLALLTYLTGGALAGRTRVLGAGSRLDPCSRTASSLWLRSTLPLGREAFLCLIDRLPNSRLCPWPQGNRALAMGSGVVLPRVPLTPSCAHLGVRGHALRACVSPTHRPHCSDPLVPRCPVP